MQRRTAALVAVLAFGTGFAACSKDNKTATKTDGTTTTVVAAVTTAPTTTVTSPPSGPAATPEAAAKGLFNAWKKNDAKDADKYAKQDAIKAIFAHPYTDASVTYADQGCQPQGGQFNCAWSYDGGALIMTVEAWPGGGFVVASTKFIAD